MQLTNDQFALIKQQFATLKERSAFYAAKFDGIDLTDVQTQEDFEKLPFSEKDDLRNAYPLGLQACPTRRSCASTAPAAPRHAGHHPYTQQDVTDWPSSSHAATRRRASRTATASTSPPLRPVDGGHRLPAGRRAPGRHDYPHGPGNTEKQLRMMQDLKSTVLCATSSYALLLAEEMQGQGALYSCDVAEHRVGLIRSAVERMSFAHVTALCNDATRPNPKLPAADRILVDAPCSGLGILAKKPDIRYKTLEKARHDELLATQSSILDTAAALLKAGGRLVYSTCTIDPAENEEQVAAFLARHPEFRVVRPAVAFPDGMTVGEHGALSVPTRTGMDGFFLCAMQKTQ